MRPFDDTAFLSPENRMRELAAIFASAILRLHSRSALNEIALTSEATCLEVPAETVLTVSHGG